MQMPCHAWIRAAAGVLLVAVTVASAADEPAPADGPAPRLVVENAARSSSRRLAVSPNGQLLATLADGGSELHVWEQATGRLLCKRDAGRDGMLAFSGDNNQLALTGTDHMLRIWDLRRCDGEPRVSKLGTGRGPWSLHTLADGRVLVQGDDSPFISDLFSTASIVPPPPGPEQAALIAHTQDGSWALEEVTPRRPPGTIVTSASPLDRQLRVVALASGAFEALSGFAGSTELPGDQMPSGTARLGAISVSARWIAVQGPSVDTASKAVGTRLTVYDRTGRRAVASMALVSTVPPLEGVSQFEADIVRAQIAAKPPVFKWISFSADEQRIYAVQEVVRDAYFHREDEVLVLRRSDLAIERRLPLPRSGAPDQVAGPTLSTAEAVPGGKAFAWTNGRDIGVVRLGEDGPASHTWTPVDNSVLALAFLRDGRLLTLSGGVGLSMGDYRNRVTRWPLTGGTPETLGLGVISAMQAISANGTRLLQLLGDPEGPIVRGLDSTTGTVLWSVRGEEVRGCEHSQPKRYGPSSMALSGDGRLAATLWPTGAEGSRTVVLCVFDMESGQLLASSDAPRGDLRFVAGTRSMLVHAGRQIIQYELAGNRLSRGAEVTAEVLGPWHGAPATVVVWRGKRRAAAAVDVAGLARLDLPDGEGASVAAADTQGHHLATAAGRGLINLYELKDGVAQQPPLALARGTGTVVALAFSSDGRWLAAATADGSTALWDTASGGKLADLYSFTDGTWAIVDAAGHFDSNALDSPTPRLHWVLPDEPLHGYPLETFMREYYEPQLLPRLLRGEAISKVRTLASLNRALPVVRIARIDGEAGDRVAVTLEAESTSRAGKPGGVAELRLFRDGQLVARVARDDRSLQLDARSGKALVAFRGIRLPSSDRPIEFAAYAFNDDQLKSETARDTFRRSAVPARRRTAYVVSIGVNRHDDPAWNLNFAADDARAMQEVLERRLRTSHQFADVVSVPLISDASGGDATKARIKTTLRALATIRPPAAEKEAAGGGRLTAATPDDALIVSFSGHGYAGLNGEFYLVPSDTGSSSGRAVTDELLAHSISSRELTEWMQDIDAGDITVVIDACQSATAIARDGFKPGPMGSRGLGQLAYDKGMRVLAASQASDAALESGTLRHGLLTHALLTDGLDRGQADWRPADKRIDIAEWLAYSLERVPLLAAEVRGGAPSAASGARFAGVVTANGDRTAATLVQRPALFDFAPATRSISLTP
jgi:WD40 repeat protein